jgi:hypothetical protein
MYNISKACRQIIVCSRNCGHNYGEAYNYSVLPRSFGNPDLGPLLVRLVSSPLVDIPNAKSHKRELLTLWATYPNNILLHTLTTSRQSHPKPSTPSLCLRIA